MIQATINLGLNLLAISYRQHVTLSELQERHPEFEALVQQLAPGFCVLVDLSLLDSMDYACASELAIVMDLCRVKGVGKVVRVIPDPRKDIGLKVMSFFHYGQGVPIVTCETVAEAIERLSK